MYIDLRVQMVAVDTPYIKAIHLLRFSTSF